MSFQKVTPLRLATGAILATVTSYYQVPTNIKTLLKTIQITNTTAGALTATVFVSTSASPPNTDAILFQVSVPANTPFQWSGTVVMETTERLLAIGSAAGLNIRASGGEAA